MIVVFVIREPVNQEKLYKNPWFIESFQKLGWLEFFNRINGYNEVAIEFSMNMKSTNG